MRSQTLFVSLHGGGIVFATGPDHPEPIPGPGVAAPSWNRCTIPACRHDPCPAKLRAWGRYGQRYICEESGCPHADCPPRLRAEEDGQPFGEPYDGPAHPQHVVDLDGRPLGAPMIAVKDADGEWHLVPRRSATADLDG